MALMALQESMAKVHDSSQESIFVLPCKLLIMAIEGIALFSIPPLPIRSHHFRFLTKIDLTMVGLEVEDVPFEFGWKLELLVYSEKNLGETLIREIGETEGFGLGMELPDFLEEGRGEEQGTETGLTSCFRDTFESVSEVFEASEEPSPRETPTMEAPKKKRVKIPAGRTDLSHARPFKRQKAKSSTPTEPKSKPAVKSAKKAVPSTRKSLRIALPKSAKTSKKGNPKKQAPEQVEDLVSSPEETPAGDAGNTPQEQVSSPVSEEQQSVPPPEPIPEPPQPTPSKPSTRPALKSSPPKTVTKRKTPSKPAITHDSEEESSPEPTPKKAKKSTPTTPSAKTAKFLQRSVVRGKIVTVTYFQKQRLEVFLDKLRAQGWLDLFTNTQLGCSGLELAEFYANCSITQGVVMSIVSGKKLRFDAKKLGEILGVPSMGFDVYVREDKTVLGTARLLELAQRLSQETGLQTPRSVKKGDMTSLHQLLFWFIIKNVIPRGQGRNLADAMDQCLIDLMDREEPINLPALMIRHIARIANASREHDLGYGFLLTMVFEHFGVKLTKKVGVQFVDEIGSSTLMGCGYTLVEGTAQEQGSKTLCPPVSGSSSSGPSIEAVVQAQAQLTSELSAVKSELAEERAQTAKRHEDLLSLLSALSAKLSMPPPAP